jgi:hypothetical protein
LETCIPKVAVLPVEHPQLRPIQTVTRGDISGVRLDETPISIGEVPAMGRVATTNGAYRNLRLKPSTE